MATVNGTSVSDTLFAGSGSDEFNLFGGNDSLDAGGGNDTVFAGAGNDTVRGGSGNDTINGADGNDVLEGGDAEDTVFGGAGDDIIYGDSASSPDGSGDADTLYGDAGNDVLVSTAADGNLVYGGTGNDTLDDGDGAAQLYGDDGNDTIYGRGGNDTLYGGAGDDTLFGADDTFDDFYGGTGNDTIYAGNANDNWIYGGDDDDEIYGGAGSESIEGGSGRDALYAGSGNDEVLGGDGNDLIQGQQGNDTLFGGAGADTFELQDTAGQDTYFGGAGADDTDLIRFVGNTDATITFSSGESGSFTQNGGASNGTFADIEATETSGGNDVLNASQSNASQSLYAGAGADTVSGGTAADTIQGGAGADTLTGGGGDDTFIFDRDPSDDIITDFDMGHADSDGFTNDQLDVSGLRDLDGNPVDVADVTVESGSGGFARLRFPEGETVTLQGVSPAQASAPGALYSMGIPCFTGGTPILTPDGPRVIDALQVGDFVCTRDNGPQKIRWIGRRVLGAKELAAWPKLAPVRIAPGQYGNERPILVSPQHGVLLCHEGEERLVRAVHLARLNGGRVRRAAGVRGVTYFHLMFEAHQIIYGDGIPSESFLPGPCALRSLDEPKRAELRTLFPQLELEDTKHATLPTARSFLAWAALPMHVNGLSAPT